ncbi:MAG: hypothetical protein ACREO8_08050 [Luteimonas sp.]
MNVPGLTMDESAKPDMRLRTPLSADSTQRLQSGDWQAATVTLVVCAFAFAFAFAFAMKSPGALTSPPFWAEDGIVFFQQQHHAGTSLLLEPYAGYLHFIPRLIAWISSVAPLEWVPLAFNASTWAINSFCIAYFLLSVASARLALVAFAAIFLWRRTATTPVLALLALNVATNTAKLQRPPLAPMAWREQVSRIPPGGKQS